MERNKQKMCVVLFIRQTENKMHIVLNEPLTKNLNLKK